MVSRKKTVRRYLMILKSSGTIVQRGLTTVGSAQSTCVDHGHSSVRMIDGEWSQQLVEGAARENVPIRLAVRSQRTFSLVPNCRTPLEFPSVEIDSSLIHSISPNHH